MGWGYPGSGYGYGSGLGALGWGLGGLGLGLALGSGIGAWGIGSPYYNWGYANYANPYASYAAMPAVAGVAQPVVAQSATAPYDYSQPLDTQAAPPEQAASDAAMQTFDAARQAFKAGDYKQALALTDQALKTMPNDASLHEFRAWYSSRWDSSSKPRRHSTRY